MKSEEERDDGDLNVPNSKKSAEKKERSAFTSFFSTADTHATANKPLDAEIAS